MITFCTVQSNASNKLLTTKQIVPKYRKKPVVIEAWEFNSNTFPKSIPKDIVSKLIFDVKNKTLLINTLEGLMTANNEDYIIKGVSGELYPCKPDIFKMTYEEVWE